MELTVLQQVAAIQRMPLAKLRDKWRALFGTDAPAYSAEQMARRLAWRVQELAGGGLSDQAQRTLTQVAAEISPAGARRRNRSLTRSGWTYASGSYHTAS